MSAHLEFDAAAPPAIASPIRDYLEGLNIAQRKAVKYGIGDDAAPTPLLMIAGAGTGKTNTLAHRFAHLILKGADPQRILLLTFTRRAAAEMTRRAQRILAQALDSAVGGAGRAGILARSGRAPSTALATDCSACTHTRSGSIRRSPSSIARTRQIS